MAFPFVVNNMFFPFHIILLQIEKIPQCFSSMEHYFGSFKYPLLEETRTQLCSSMNPISKSPCVEVISIKEIKPYGKGFFNIHIRDCKDCPTILMPGNIFILSNVKPYVVSDLERDNNNNAKSWTFATKFWAKGNNLEEEFLSDNDPTRFSVKTWNKDFEIPMDEKTKNKPMFLVILVNVLSNIRIWNALHMIKRTSKHSSASSSMIFNQVLGLKDSCNNLDFSCDACEAKVGMSFSHNDDLFSTLNEPQARAVQRCLEKTSCAHKSSIELIWGPPGTGKTKTVAVLLLQFRKNNHRVLTCAPTNTAIMQVRRPNSEILIDLYCQNFTLYKYDWL